MPDERSTPARMHRRCWRAVWWLAAVSLVASACGADEIGHGTELARSVATTIAAPRGGPPPGLTEESLPTTLACEEQVMEMVALSPDARGAETAEAAVSEVADRYGKHHPLPPDDWKTWDEHAKATDASDAKRYIVTAHDTEEPVAILGLEHLEGRGFFVTEVTMCAGLYEQERRPEQEYGTAHTFKTEQGEVTLACAEAEVEVYMFAPSLGNGATDPMAAAERTLGGAPVSIDTSGLQFEEGEFGVIARNEDGYTVAWVSPAQLRDGTWGAGEVAFCGSALG